MADPARHELTTRPGGAARGHLPASHRLPCIAGLFLLACTQDPAAPPALDDGDGMHPPLSGDGISSPPGDPPTPPNRADAGTSDGLGPAGSVTTLPLDSGMDDSGPLASSDAGPPPRTARVSLIDPYAWTQLGPEEDLFEDRPEDVECAVDAAAAELLGGEIAFGVDTGRCSYVTARQVTREHVAAGETIIVRLWHFELNAPKTGKAHAVVDVDGLRLLDERVPIPAPGGLIRATVPLERTIAAGAPVHFHLHNHGANSWALVEISTGP